MQSLVSHISSVYSAEQNNRLNKLGYMILIRQGPNASNVHVYVPVLRSLTLLIVACSRMHLPPTYRVCEQIAPKFLLSHPWHQCWLRKSHFDLLTLK